MSTYAHAYFFKNKKSLKQFQVDINRDYGWKDWKNHPSVIKSTFYHFSVGMFRMLKELDYTLDPDNISVALRASDLDELKLKDKCNENDINTLKEGFKETKAEFVFIVKDFKQTLSLV